jgi:nucleotide-binding universal stress UspA family protein
MKRERQNVLLVIPADKEPEQALRAAIDAARERRGTLVAVVVLDPELPTRAASTLTDVGFMGERVGQQVSEAIAHEYRARSEALLQALAERAKKDGVVVTPLIEAGEAGEICGRVIRSHQIGTVVLVAAKRSWLARLFARGTVDADELSGCEVLWMEDD